MPRSSRNIVFAFRKDIADSYGIPAALVHQEITRWCHDNEVKQIEEVFIDGYYWVYTSHNRIARHFGCMSISTVRRSVKILIDSNLIVQRNRELETNPSAVLYRALEYEQGGVQNEHAPPVQNEQPPPVQNEQPEQSNVEQLNMNRFKSDIVETDQDPPLSKEEELKRIARMKAHLKATQPQEEEKNESS